MTDYNNSFGFDIGITSIGSAVMSNDKNNLEYLGVRIFDQATEAKEARLHRSARRNVARKKWRKDQLKKAFIEFGVISKEEMDLPNYNLFTVQSDKFDSFPDKTVYHLRKRALTEQISKRGIYLCLLNILHARGHFNMQQIDFEKDTIRFEDFKDKFYEITEPYFHLIDSRKQEFETDYLIKLFEGTLAKSDITKMKKSFVDLEEEKAFLETMSLLKNYKIDPKKIDESFEFEKDKLSLNDFREMDQLPDFFFECINLYDMANIYRVVKEYNYLCEKAVDKIDAYEETIEKYGLDSEDFKKLKKDIEGISKEGIHHVRSWRNIENNYPNQLYLKEVKAILNKQEEFYDCITPDFKDVCLKIVSARIPYYIGPLDPNGKNAWVIKTGKAMYSYDYSRDSFNEDASIQKWKERMISRCTYFPEEHALPKGSFLAETFSILNEMNGYSALDKNGNDYYLTFDDKVKVFDCLFLKREKVTFQDICDLLNLSQFGPKTDKAKMDSFNNTYTLYRSIIRVLPTLALSSITDILKGSKNIDIIEEIILTVNIYDDEEKKCEYIWKTYGFDMKDCAKLAKLKSNSFFSFSKKLLFSIINKNGNTLMDELISNNTPDYSNVMNYHLFNATDLSGKPISFLANKYDRKLKENNGELNINLLMDNEKPVIPMSRPTVRALNECMKIYSEMVKVFGAPKRVVIETARDFKDHTEVGTKPEKTAKNLETLYNNLQRDMKEKKFYEAGSMENWEDLKQYVNSNKVKLELYIRQNGYDLITGEHIDINHLENYEVDHILPRGFGDDSKDNKILISKLANDRKGDRLPLQFIEDGNVVGSIKVTSSSYLKRVNSLYQLGMISEKKYKMLTLETDIDLDKFIDQNLVDTRYIIREFMTILDAYNRYHHYDTHIVALHSAYTSTYRKAFHMRKDRDFNDPAHPYVSHHAHDAALLLVADKTLSKMFPNYDSRKPSERKEAFRSYRDFMKQMNDAKVNSEEREALNKFIQYAYFRAFDESPELSTSYISQVKRTTPYYSLKVNKNYKGKFFDATIYSQDSAKNQQGNVLSLLGINNEKRVFSSVEIAAIDFYKVSSIDKKGKVSREHIAIHIPKVIIKSDGTIDQQQYKKLILEHYKKPELLDSNGNINTIFYRFRIYKNDIILDTELKWPMIMVGGSMANKRIEKGYINQYSYDCIYKTASNYYNYLQKEYNIKSKKNPNGVDPKSIDSKVYVNYLHEIWQACPSLTAEEIDNAIYPAIQKIENLYDLCIMMSYYNQLSLIPDKPAFLTRYMPTANNNTISKNPDAEYIKLKYNILGFRYEKGKGGGLVINTPKEIPGAFSLIKREDFSWKMSKDNI